MALDPETVSLAELRQRATVLGIPIPDDAWEQLYPMLSRALAPIRAVDSDELKTLAPSVIFRPVSAEARTS